LLERRLASTEADLQQKLSTCQEVITHVHMLDPEISALTITPPSNTSQPLTPR